MILMNLFLGFLYVGCFSFGGAYAAIPLIREVVLDYGWINDEALTYMIAISESTPGSVMVNLATYVGVNQAGVMGAFVATFASVLPAFLIILLIMALLKNALDNKYFKALLDGMKPAIIGIILGIGIYMIFKNCFESNEFKIINTRSLYMTVFLFAVYYGSRKVFKNGLTPIRLIIVAAITGILANL